MTVTDTNSPAEKALSARTYWQSKLQQDLPKATLAPDFQRSGTDRHTYREFSFDLPANVVAAVRNRDRGDWPSDRDLCTGLLTLLLAKYSRDEELVVGIQMSGGGWQGSTVVPLRLVCRPDDRLSNVIRAVSVEVDEIEPLPANCADVAELLNVAVDERRHPLFDIAIAVGNAETTVDIVKYPVDVAFLFTATEPRILGRVVYAADLFDVTRIESVISHLSMVVDQIARATLTSVREIDILSADERHRIQREFNQNSVSLQNHGTLHELFERQAARSPAEIAVVHRTQQLTYAELNARANRIAHSLLSLGLERGAFVGILLNRSCDFLAAMFGVFKAGGAYVPLDTTYPRDRIQYMLEDSRAGFVISNAFVITEFVDALRDGSKGRVLLSLDGVVDTAVLAGSRQAPSVLSPNEIEAAPADDPGLPLAGRDRAYMIYTSGSTGRPKGAICRHDGALNHLFGELHGIGIKGPFNFLQTAASSSDISVWQFTAALLTGGRTVIADYEIVVDPPQLFATLRDQHLTVAEPVPVVLRSLLDYVADLDPADRALPALRVMMSTGEALSGELVDRWLALYPHIPLANTYGPTETSDDVTLHVMREPIAHRWAVAPIGPPLPNVRIFIVDRDLRPVPIGVPGELCIAGIAVGEGYWNQPEKTAAAFVSCPFTDVAEGPMYRSGDLARWLPDGSIEFLGRIDQQVKVRGFRVEPGEIENMMTRHPAVHDAAVIAVDDSAGNKRLIGYYVSNDLAADDMRQFLKGALADYMVPAVLVSLDALPLTPLGKVDRKALSREEFYGDAESGTSNYLAPRNRTEEIIATAWSKVLKRRRVGINDNFFETGGDSILVIHAIAELKRAGLQLTPKQIFLHPTIAMLAPEVRPISKRVARAASAQKDADAWHLSLPTQMPPGVREAYPMSAAQLGMYLQLLLSSRQSGAYIEQVAFDLVGELDPEIFGLAWQQVVNDIDVLRTGIVRTAGSPPLQMVFHSAALTPDYQDWRPRPTQEQQSSFAELLTEERRRGFDLRAPPLMRIVLIRLASDRWRVLWTYHHIILDGWSEALVLQSLFAAYGALTGPRVPDAKPHGRYREFVAWAESQDLAEAEAYWRKKLARFTDPTSIDYAAAAALEQSRNEISHAWREVLLSEAETGRIEHVARRNRLTISALIHGLWGLLLHRRSGSKDVVFGSVSSGRQCPLAEADTIPGLFVATQPLRTCVNGKTTLVSWLNALQLDMAEMREHEHTPLALIQQWSEVPVAKRPLFDSLVVMGSYSTKELASHCPVGLALANLSFFTQPLYALTLFVVTQARLSVRIVYDRRRYDAGIAQRLTNEFVSLLRSFAEDPDQELATLLANEIN